MVFQRKNYLSKCQMKNSLDTELSKFCQWIIILIPSFLTLLKLSTQEGNVLKISNIWHIKMYISIFLHLLEKESSFKRTKKVVITFFFDGVTPYCTVFVFLRFLYCAYSSLPLYSCQYRKCIFLNVLP